MSYEKLEKLNQLRQSGVLNEEEFQVEKRRLLNDGNASSAEGKSITVTASEGQYCMFIHLAQFAGFLIPLAGLILPIVLWQSKKQSKIINEHGKAVCNWMISVFIYAIISLILCLIIIGFFLLLALAVCNIVFIIMGAIKANNGQVWNYPMSIKFFAVNVNLKAGNADEMTDILDAR